MENKITLSENRKPKKFGNNHKIKIFSVREIKSNPFKYFEEDIKGMIELKKDELSLEYKIETAIEYELIYDSYFLD